MTTALQKSEDGTITLTITLPNTLLKKAFNEELDQAVKASELPGFRKGKAPKKLVEEQIDKDKIREKILQKLIPSSYIEAVKEHNLKPVINPRIQVLPDQIGIDKIEKSEDWQFTAVTCEAPNVDLGAYKDHVQKLNVKSKIIVPGKEQEKPKFEDVIDTVLKSASCKISKVLIDQEVEKLLARFLDEVRKLGLTLDQYLSGSGKTADQLRKEYEQRAENDIKLEFILQKIAETEKITVEEKEIEEAIQKAKDEKEKENLKSNRYLLASILKQQKTLDFLKNL